MQLATTWPILKAFATERNLSIQWIVVNKIYYLAAIDGQIELTTQIMITDPPVPGSYQQDFENNYKASGNGPTITYIDQPTPDPWLITPVDSNSNPFSISNPFPTSDGVQLINKRYDTGQATYPSPTQEVYITYIGGISGTPIQQIVINYVDSSKNQLLNWQRSNWNGSAWEVS